MNNAIPGYRPNTLDGLDDDRLAVALDVLRFLRSTIRGNCRSWWYRSGTPEFQAAADLFNTGHLWVREIAAGLQVMIRRKHRRVSR